VTPTSSLLTLVGLCALFAGALLLWIVWGAFEDRPSRGALALVVPPYALWYGWTLFSHPRHKGIVLVIVTLLVAAILGALLASVMGRPSGPLIAR